MALVITVFDISDVTNSGNSDRRMLTSMEIFGAAFLFIWCGNGVPKPLFQHYTSG